MLSGTSTHCGQRFDSGAIIKVLILVTEYNMDANSPFMDRKLWVFYKHGKIEETF